ncbi:hypothetical protein CMEL01_12439 [Colletotrichum melonis]|uniref:Uncharacterized protein n=1 Tax=Colletotrichum melonis TaxID=1209925 RepID=A0AAI9UUR3_9PEZI|nr:hypothetical protein CMEL01_12439 [Colletotrichum melonis]
MSAFQVTRVVMKVASTGMINELHRRDFSRSARIKLFCGRTLGSSVMYA